MWAANYVKGGRVVEIKERHLAKIFADTDSVLSKDLEKPPKDMEEFRKECGKLLRRKGKRGIKQ